MRRVFIASLGNPGPTYENTFHSAGHTLLFALAAHAQTPPFASSRRYSGALFTELPTAAFWASPSYMNESGRALAPAWHTWAAAVQRANDTPHLVLLHDELEETFGMFRLRQGKGLSHRGHNGLRSVLGVQSLRDLKLTRIGVGIGPRPRSRESSVVAEFVLQRMTEWQKSEVEQLARPVWRRLV